MGMKKFYVNLGKVWKSVMGLHLTTEHQASYFKIIFKKFFHEYLCQHSVM